MRSARASQSAWVTARAATLPGPCTGDVGEYRGGHGLEGLAAGRRGGAPSRRRSRTPGWWAMSPARKRRRASRSTGSAWRRLTVSSAVAIADRVGLARTASRPDRRRRRAGLGGDRPPSTPARPGRPASRGQHHLGFAGGQLGELVARSPHSPAATRAAPGRSGPPWWPGMPTWRELAHGLIGGRDRQHRPAGRRAASTAAARVVVLP